MSERAEYRLFPRGELLPHDQQFIEHQPKDERRAQLERKRAFLQAEIINKKRGLELSREMAREEAQLQRALDKVTHESGGEFKKIEEAHGQRWLELTQAQAELQKTKWLEFGRRRELQKNIDDLTRSINQLRTTLETMQGNATNLQAPLTLLDERRKEEGSEVEIQAKISELEREVRRVDHELKRLK